MYSRHENIMEKFKSPTVTSYTDLIRRITDTTQTQIYETRGKLKSSTQIFVNALSATKIN
jgi:hypothetical protein